MELGLKDMRGLVTGAGKRLAPHLRRSPPPTKAAWPGLPVPTSPSGS